MVRKRQLALMDIGKTEANKRQMAVNKPTWQRRATCSSSPRGEWTSISLLITHILSIQNATLCIEYSEQEFETRTQVRNSPNYLKIHFFYSALRVFRWYWTLWCRLRPCPSQWTCSHPAQRSSKPRRSESKILCTRFRDVGDGVQAAKPTEHDGWYFRCSGCVRVW